MAAKSIPGTTVNEIPGAPFAAAVSSFQPSHKIRPQIPATNSGHEFRPQIPDTNISRQGI